MGSWVDDTTNLAARQMLYQDIFQTSSTPLNYPYRPFPEPAGLMLSSRSALLKAAIASSRLP
jgi:hypothetical protein